MKKIATFVTLISCIIGSNNFITTSDDKNSKQAQSISECIAEKQAEQKLQKFQREQLQKEENQMEENRKKDLIDSHSGLIRTLLKVDLNLIKKYCYESHDEKSISRQVYLKDGSYFVTKFDTTTLRPLETRLYEPTDDNDYINTKLTIYYDGKADVHSLDFDSGQINCHRITQLGYDSATVVEPPYKEYRLSKSTLELKPKKPSRSYLDIETIIEQIKFAQEHGNIIEMIEIE